MDHLWMLFSCGPSFSKTIGWKLAASCRCICKKSEQARLECGKGGNSNFGTILGINHRLERVLHVVQNLEIRRDPQKQEMEKRNAKRRVKNIWELVGMLHDLSSSCTDFSSDWDIQVSWMAFFWGERMDG
ncbi:hypothetical protein BSKO_09718 [Bryopsis sp. KO-2023]|nr:hypothetical protein BSKO_09718 [Bryopsis sp. KO-2023]